MVTISTQEPLAVAAVDAIHTGNVEALRRLLGEHPDLATARLGDEDHGDHGDHAGMTRSLLHVVTDWPGHFPNGAETVAVLAARSRRQRAVRRSAHRDAAALGGQQRRRRGARRAA
jgi:hypothetical protein